jgi:isopenicillin N synthase-like dioxygenase
MNTSMQNLQKRGFISVPYPSLLREAVAKAEQHWEAFCSLPDEVKRSFPYSSNGAGVGYEDKRISGNSADYKENFDLTIGDMEWLEDQAKSTGNETILTFVLSAIKVAGLIAPSIIDFADQVEKSFGMEGFKDEVEESLNAYFIRFIHYFPGATVEQETAEAHTDQSGMTPHLFSSAPGLEHLTQDMQWEAMPVSQGEMVIIPSMQLQLRSKGQLKATVHRVVATPETIKTGRYSAVCFVQFKRTPKYDKTKGRLQVLHKENLGFNYRLSPEEFAEYFKA